MTPRWAHRAAVAGTALVAVALVTTAAIGRARGQMQPPTMSAGTVTAPTPTITAVAHSRPAVTVTVGGQENVHAVRTSFLGVSLEYYELESALGTDAQHLDPVFDALMHHLSSLPSVRVGGESADWSWVRTAGVTRPKPVNFTITDSLTNLLAASGKALDARYILDLNLAANNSRLIDTEGRALAQAIPSRYIRAVEIGNEPELYPTVPWSRPPLPKIYARANPYGVENYIDEFNELTVGLPDLATAGPATGNSSWADALAENASSSNRLGLITIDRYALPRCGLTAQDPDYPTVPKLLDPATATALANSIAPVISEARSRGLPVRVDEVGDAPCFGVLGVSNTFASAIFSLDASFALASSGVDGINFHTEPAAAHRLFNFWESDGVWHGSVAPVYYGLLMFSWAAPAGSHLVATHSSSDTVTTYATRRNHTERVILVNRGASRTVCIRLPGDTAQGSILRLSAPSAASTTGVTIGGASFAKGTTTGELDHTADSEAVVPGSRGRYDISVVRNSAVLLTVTE
jgi:hypothetical protein